MNISKNEVIRYLAKAKAVRLEPESAADAAMRGGMILSHPQGVEPVRAVMMNPANRLWSSKGGKNIIRPRRVVDYRILRRLADKAWLINTIIVHLQNSIRPFLKPSTDENVRGFQIRAKDPDVSLNDGGRARVKQISQFFLKTGLGPDPERRDDLVAFGMKAVRDYLTIDQLTTELQRSRNRSLFAFWALDPATISRVTEDGYDGDDAIRYIQEIDLVETATFTDSSLIFDYSNPRSDVEYAGYGYSLTEQAIDLIIAAVNSFAYNAGALTEDNLPRGMLLLNGDADMETVEAIEDYIVDVMSAGPAAKWRIPIIPSGTQGGEGKKGLEWVSFRTSNRDQEFIEWLDFVWSSVCALFGIDMEELGIRTKKSGPVLGDNVAPRIEASKSRGLSSTLTFLESHFQKILDNFDDRFDFEFVGYERNDPKAKSDLEEAELRTFRTIDEIRREKDLEPFNEEWSKIPLNPHVVQLVQAEKQSQMGMMGGMGGGMPGDDGAGGGQGGDPGADGPYDNPDYRGLMFEDEGAAEPADEADGAEEAEGADDEARTEKSIDDDDVIEITV